MKTKTIGQAAAVLAVGWAVSATAGAIPDTQLEVRTFENVPYISGGVGLGERKTLRAMAHGDNLQLSFALANGSYLGGAEVIIKDNRGQGSSRGRCRWPAVFCQAARGKLHRPRYDDGTEAHSQREYSAGGTGASLFHMERR